MNALSLFCGGGIGETYLKDIGIETVVANELLKNRAEIYKYRYPNTDIIIGDIKEKKKEIIEKCKQKKIDIIIATPPCQGMSNIGKREYNTDKRNFLIFDVMDIIDEIKPDYIFIENVPKFLSMKYPYRENHKNEVIGILDILKEKYEPEYEIKSGIYNAANYNVPQTRKRAIIRVYKKGLIWEDPEKKVPKTLRETIGHLPSVESGEDSGIKYHIGPKHNKHHIECLKHTPTGKSALKCGRE